MVYLLAGLTGSGKTTLARTLEFLARFEPPEGAGEEIAHGPASG